MILTGLSKLDLYCGANWCGAPLYRFQTEESTVLLQKHVRVNVCRDVAARLGLNDTGELFVEYCSRTWHTAFDDLNKGLVCGTVATE